METVTNFIFLGSKITEDSDCSHEIQRCLLLGRSYDKPRQHIKRKRHHFANKGPYSQGYGFSSSHVWMWELDHKEGWALKNWCLPTVVLEKTLKSPLNYKEIQPVYPKGNQPWIFIWRTDAKAEAPILWPPDAKNLFIGKDPDAGKDLKAGGEGGNRGWDGWMASSTQWTWVWANFGRQWKTGKPGVLQSMGSQRVRHDLVTEHRLPARMWVPCSSGMRNSHTNGLCLSRSQSHIPSN